MSGYYYTLSMTPLAQAAKLCPPCSVGISEFFEEGVTPF